MELNGDGYGDGSGDGSGYGSGSSDGYGDGSGYGYGSSDGYGDGYGSGYSSGDGYGSGYTAYLKALLDQFKAEGKLAVWRANKDGTPSNGGSGKPRKVGDVDEVSGPLELCSHRCLHATLRPDKWKGDRWFVVELAEPVIGGDEKMGSLKRTIIADLGKCPF
jgi:hypothetical protein